MGRRPSPPASSLSWLIAGAAACLALVLTLDLRLYINGDNVDYILLGRSVRAGHLWPSDKYPPLLPLLLAAVQAVFGMALLPQKLLVLAFGLGSVWMLGRVLRRRLPPGTGPWVLWTAATLIPVVEFSHYTMSEVPYLFFSLAACDLLDRRAAAPAPETSWTALLKEKRTWGLALLIAAAFYTRTAGITLAAALLGVLLLARRFRETAALAAALGVTVLPWMLHSALSGGSPYWKQFLLVNPYYPEFGTLTAGSLLRRLWENGGFYLLQEIPTTVFPLLYNSTYSPPGEGYFPIWISLPLLAPLVLGVVGGIRRRDPLAAVLLLSLALALVWPIIWAGSRFLVPVVPLLLLFWWSGWSEPERTRRGIWWPRIRAGILVLLVALSARNLVFYRLETREYAPVWKNYFAALDWIRENTPKDAVIIDRKPPFVEYVAERKAFTFPREADSNRMMEAFRERGATHVVLSSLPYDDIKRYLGPAVEREREHFEILARWPDPRVYVLRFFPEGGRGAGGGAPAAGAPSPGS